MVLAAAPSEEGGRGGGVELKALMTETTQQSPEHCVHCSTEQTKILWSDTRYLWSCIFFSTLDIMFGSFQQQPTVSKL